MGRIVDVFHCAGTLDVDMDWLNSRAKGLANIGAPTLRNQAGNPSGPVAVGDSLSRIEKTDCSVIATVGCCT